MFLLTILAVSAAGVPAEAAADALKRPQPLVFPQVDFDAMVRVRAKRFVKVKNGLRDERRTVFAVEKVFQGPANLVGLRFQCPTDADPLVFNPWEDDLAPEMAVGKTGIWLLRTDPRDGHWYGVRGFWPGWEYWNLRVPPHVDPAPAEQYPLVLQWSKAVQAAAECPSESQRQLLARYAQSQNPAISSWARRALQPKKEK